MIALSSLVLFPVVLAVQVSLFCLSSPWFFVAKFGKTPQPTFPFFPALGAAVRPSLGGPSSGVVQLCWVQQRQSTEDAGRVWKGLRPHH
jgi:hypothetical protein